MASPSCTIYLVRHGESEWNVIRRIQGQQDIKLTKKGEKQAHALKEKLKSISFSAVYSSDLIRAHHTAQILNGERNLEIMTSPLIREQKFGVYEGTYRNEKFDNLKRLLSEDKNHPHIAESQVESNKDLLDRSLSFLFEISKKHPGETILIVAHGGVMEEILIHLKFAKEEDMHTINTAYIRLECDKDKMAVTDAFGILRK